MSLFRVSPCRAAAFPLRLLCVLLWLSCPLSFSLSSLSYYVFMFFLFMPLLAPSSFAASFLFIIFFFVMLCVCFLFFLGRVFGVSCGQSASFPFSSFRMVSFFLSCLSPPYFLPLSLILSQHQLFSFLSAVVLFVFSVSLRQRVSLMSWLSFLFCAY